MQEHDGQLPAQHRAAVRAHLAECGTCRTYVETARSSAAWLRTATNDAARSPELSPTFSEVWQGVARRLSDSPPPAWWMARRSWRWPLRLEWLAVGSLAVALLLLVVNPYGRLPLAQSHEAAVAFVEASDYPVMVMMPPHPDEMTVIWLFESGNTSPVPPT